MGHLADLRGGRDASAARPSRTATCSRSTPTTRTPTATRSRSRRSAATRTSRVVVEPAGRPHLPHRGRRQPERAAVPLDARPTRRCRSARARSATLADDAGTLEALRASTRSGTFVPDLSVATHAGHDVPGRVGRRSPTATRTTTSTRKQAYAKPITRSRKLEGMWWGDGGAYFVASFARTSDGSAAQHDGQVWFLDPDADTIELKLHFAYTPGDQDSDPDGPDNITVSAHGGLIIAEDGEGASHLVGSTDARRGVLPRPQRAQRLRVRRADASPTTRRRCSRTSRAPATCWRSRGPGASSAEAPAPRSVRRIRWDPAGGRPARRCSR